MKNVGLRSAMLKRVSAPIYKALSVSLVIIAFLCWLFAPFLFGLMALLTAIVIAVAYSAHQGGVPKIWKFAVVGGYLAIDVSILLLTPEWLGAMAFSTAIVFIAILANEPVRLPRLTRVLIALGILVIDVIVFSQPSGSRLTTLTLAMPIVTVLSLLALIAYPRDYPSMPPDKWQ